MPSQQLGRPSRQVGHQRDAERKRNVSDAASTADQAKQPQAHEAGQLPPRDLP